MRTIALWQWRNKSMDTHVRRTQRSALIDSVSDVLLSDLARDRRAVAVPGALAEVRRRG